MFIQCKLTVILSIMQIFAGISLSLESEILEKGIIVFQNAFNKLDEVREKI